MNKKLEELFDLAPKEDIEVSPISVEQATEEALNNAEKIEKALPQVRGLEASDEEMDELAELAKNSYKDLMDLGMQTDSRFSSEVFNVAGTMLGHAITAKTTKIQKKLKMIELQLKKAALDQKEAAKEKDLEQIPSANTSNTGKTVIDRNEMLKLLVVKNKGQ